QTFEKLDRTRVVVVIHVGRGREPEPQRTGVRPDGSIELIHRETVLTEDEVDLAQARVSAIVRLVSLCSGLQRCFVLIHRKMEVELLCLQVAITYVRIGG